MSKSNRALIFYGGLAAGLFGGIGAAMVAQGFMTAEQVVWVVIGVLLFTLVLWLGLSWVDRGGDE